MGGLDMLCGFPPCKSCRRRILTYGQKRNRVPKAHRQIPRLDYRIPDRAVRPDRPLRLESFLGAEEGSVTYSASSAPASGKKQAPRSITIRRRIVMLDRGPALEMPQLKD